MTTGIQGHPQAGQGPELITIGFMLHLSYMVSQYRLPAHPVARTPKEDIMSRAYQGRTALAHSVNGLY